jgi:predicted alpha/beta hydrolase
MAGTLSAPPGYWPVTRLTYREWVTVELTFHQHWIDRGTDRLGVQSYPDPDPTGPAVVVFPAMGVPAGYYRPFAEALHHAGVAVSVVDLRGTGASTPRPSRRSRYGYAELAADVGAALDALADRLAGRPVLLLGHSLGGHACLLHLASRSASGGPHPRVDGLVLVAVGLPYRRLYRGVHRAAVVGLVESVNAVSAVLGYWPGWAFGGRQSRGVIRDWAHTARTGRFPAVAGVDGDTAAATVTTPVLAVSFDRDTYTPAPTVDYLVGKLTAAPVHREHLDGDADHFTWARSPDAVVERVVAFAKTLPAR